MPKPEGTPRPLLDLDVHEVSLVDQAANLTTFSLIKQLKVPEESAMSFKLTADLTVLKDMGKLKDLSKQMAQERLAMIAGTIEELGKSIADGSLTDVGQLFQAVDKVHDMIWGVESDVMTAVFKSAEGAEVSKEIKVTDEVRKAIQDGVASAVLDTDFTQDIEALKAKSVTPKRLSELKAIAEKLTAAIDEMDDPKDEDDEDTDKGNMKKPTKKDEDGGTEETDVDKAGMLPGETATGLEAPAKYVMMMPDGSTKPMKLVSDGDLPGVMVLSVDEGLSSSTDGPAPSGTSSDAPGAMDVKVDEPVIKSEDGDKPDLQAMVTKAVADATAPVTKMLDEANETIADLKKQLADLDSTPTTVEDEEPEQTEVKKSLWGGSIFNAQN